MQLAEEAGDVFRVLDNPHGDVYRIVGSTGDLQLLDNDGLIRVARRLENVRNQNDCVR